MRTGNKRPSAGELWDKDDTPPWLAPGKKRILTLDGGGVRGLISVAFLERLETQLREAEGKPDLVLADKFDLVAGTSVGAMIASMIALGRDMAEVKARAFETAEAVFKEPFLDLGLARRFDSAALNVKLDEALGDTRLGSKSLRTGLIITGKRIDTDSTWAFCNNPRMPYFSDGYDMSGKPFQGNRHYQLANIVRASTAAPFILSPVNITIHQQPTGVINEGWFVDGGVSPLNNPSIQALLMAGLPEYKFNWTLSPADLIILSVGAGLNRSPISVTEIKRTTRWQQIPIWKFVVAFYTLIFTLKVLRGMVSGAALYNLKLMQSLSNPRFSWVINSEVGDVSQGTLLDAARLANRGPLLKFQRYDVPLEARATRQWVDAAYDVAPDYDLRRAKLTDIDDPSISRELYNVAADAAKRQVSLADLDFEEPAAVNGA